MPWDDDSWRDSYDAWKLASPDDDRDGECYHEDFEIDLEGRAYCNSCDHRWWPSEADVLSFRYANEAYDRYCRRAERRERWAERWLQYTRWIRWPLGRLLDRIMPPKWRRYMDRRWRAVDDEIPF